TPAAAAASSSSHAAAVAPASPAAAAAAATGGRSAGGGGGGVVSHLSAHTNAVAAPLPAPVGPYKPWKPKTVDAFARDRQIGEGTYGSVFLARMKLPDGSQQQVALK